MKKKSTFNAKRVKTLPNAKRRFQENANKGMHAAMTSRKVRAPKQLFRRKAG